MAKTNIYLHFNGNCEEAFNHYKNVFQTEYVSFLRYSDTPHKDSVPKEYLNKIENVGFKLSEETLIMGSDTLDSLGMPFVAGNNFSIYAEADSKEEAERLFKGLSVNGKITQDLAIAHWGAYFGMCTDHFGIQWLINCEASKVK